MDFESLRARLDMNSQGALSLNGQGMILVPRHFFRYILRDVNRVTGPEVFRKIFHTTGHDGAVTFCRRFREVHQCTPRQAVEGYLKEMSARGWGHFHLKQMDSEAGAMEVILQNSALVAEGDIPSGDVIWEGSMLGAMNYLRESLGHGGSRELGVTGQEVDSGHAGARSYRITIAPIAKEKPPL